MQTLQKPRVAVCEFFDSAHRANFGRTMSDHLSAKLQQSRYYSLIPWIWPSSVRQGGTQIIETYSHRAWLAQAGRHLGVDAVVAGIVTRESNYRDRVAATLIETRSGEMMATAEAETVDELVQAFDIRRVAKRITVNTQLIEGQVVGRNGNSIVLNVGELAGVRVGDFLTVYRALDSVPDPCDPRSTWPGNPLRAFIGKAKLLVTSPYTSLALYEGNKPSRVGDFAFRAGELLASPRKLSRFFS